MSISIVIILAVAFLFVIALVGVVLRQAASVVEVVNPTSHPEPDVSSPLQGFTSRPAEEIPMQSPLDRLMAGRRSLELQTMEFAFSCAQCAKSNESAYAKAEKVLSAQTSPEFRDQVHGLIDDFIRVNRGFSPLEQHLECQMARHEREQFQIANGLKLKALDDDGTGSRTTYADEVGIYRDSNGRWIERLS